MSSSMILFLGKAEIPCNMNTLSKSELAELLHSKYEQFNAANFIEDDPISIPHQFTQKEDIEISGFLSAIIAWGRRAMIIRNARCLMEMMDWAPYSYVMQANEEELARTASFVHRTFNGMDCRAMILALRKVYREHGGLEGIFTQGISLADADVFPAIVYARSALSSNPDFPQRTHKHLANPAKGSSAKRINMYLRWMVRDDGRGVDFGLWKGIKTRQLICPLDVHTGNVGRKLGLLTRKQNDWKAAKELTENLKQFCSEDPVKYDYSLFGLGVIDGF